MAVQELVEIKFRLADGSDIGPNKYASSTTVASLKDKLIAQWPKGGRILVAGGRWQVSCGISRGARKLAQTPRLSKKE